MKSIIMSNDSKTLFDSFATQARARLEKLVKDFFGRSGVLELRDGAKVVVRLELRSDQRSYLEVGLGEAGEDGKVYMSKTFEKNLDGAWSKRSRNKGSAA